MEKNHESKGTPGPMELRPPKDRERTAKALGWTAIKGAAKK